MLLTRLILLQRSAIIVIAQQSIMKSLTPFDGCCHGRTADDEAVVFDASEVLKGLELSGEVGFVCCGDVCTELEED